MNGSRGFVEEGLRDHEIVEFTDLGISDPNATKTRQFVNFSLRTCVNSQGTHSPRVRMSPGRFTYLPF
jgi:hypothetical protein